jgi:hypothetical protein
MTSTNTDDLPLWTPLNEPGAALAAGILALTAALAAALAATMAAPLFAAALAVGLGANAGMLAANETQVVPWPLARVLGWGLAFVGWIGYAVTLLHTPLAYPDLLRAAATGLIAFDALMRVFDRMAQGPDATPGLAVGSFFGAAGIAVLWLGSDHALSGLLQTIAIAVSLELCAVGSAWLVVAWLEHNRRHTALVEGAQARAAVRYSVLHRA